MKMLQRKFTVILMKLSKTREQRIKNLYYFKGYGGIKLMNKFPGKGWKKNTLMTLYNT